MRAPPPSGSCRRSSAKRLALPYGEGNAQALLAGPCPVPDLKGRKRAAEGLFGWSVAVEGDWTLVGAPGDGNGRVFAYSRDPGSGEWLPAGDLEPEEGKGGTGTKLNFGRSLALDRGRAVVGAPGHDGPGKENSDMGSAYVFLLKDGEWEQEAWLLPSDGTRWWYNGEAVDIDRRTVVVGSRGDWGDRGAAYVYERKGKNWVEKQRLDPSQTDEYQYAGSYAVAISGRRILLGAPLDDEAGGRSGAIYLFMKRGMDWIEEERIRPPDLRADDTFGAGVAIFRRFMLVGADGGDTSGRDGVGAAYVIK